MIHIDVIAHGMDGSWVRKVQHNPELAVGLLRALRKANAQLSLIDQKSGPVVVAEQLRTINEDLKKAVIESGGPA